MEKDSTGPSNNNNLHYKRQTSVSNPFSNDRFKWGEQSLRRAVHHSQGPQSRSIHGSSGVFKWEVMLWGTLCIKRETSVDWHTLMWVEDALYYCRPSRKTSRGRVVMMKKWRTQRPAFYATIPPQWRCNKCLLPLSFLIVYIVNYWTLQYAKFT